MPAVEVRHQRVVVETDRYRVEGDIALPLEGYRSHLSDYLNRQDQEFIHVLANAELNALQQMRTRLEHPRSNACKASYPFGCSGWS